MIFRLLSMINGAYGNVNAVRGHVVFLNLLFRTIELRISEGKFETFSNIYLILVPGKRFINGNEISQTSTAFCGKSYFKSIVTRVNISSCVTLWILVCLCTPQLQISPLSHRRLWHQCLQSHWLLVPSFRSRIRYQT